MSGSRTVAIVYNTAAYVYRFRMNLIKRLQTSGYDVLVISPFDEYVKKLTDAGVRHSYISLSQYGMNPISEINTILQLRQIFTQCKPICSLHFTIKPNIFGTVAARLAGVPVINNITGAGKGIIESGFSLRWFIYGLYYLALKSSSRVFFQNDDDMHLFLSKRLVAPDVAQRIPGSGVDLTRFSPHEIESAEEFCFLFVGRLLYQKGICEYLDAARKVLEHSHGMRVRFEIVGDLEHSLEYIGENTLQRYLESRHITFHGVLSPERMPEIFRKSHCVVLPSYYGEGIPRSLLEAAATARPIITTDAPGCCEVVEEGVNGFKCPVKDSDALAVAMQRMLAMNIDELNAMGAAGRSKVESEFDEEIVLDAYMSQIRAIAS